MEMTTVPVRPHAATVSTPVGAAHIHMAFAAPVFVKPFTGCPYVVGCAIYAAHYAAAEIKKHY